MKVIGLTGLAGVGKDTAAMAIASIPKEGTAKYAFADPIYNMLHTVFDLPVTTGKKGRKKTQVIDKNSIVEGTGRTVRYLLQTLGTEWGRNTVSKDVWVNQADAFLSQLEGNIGIQIVVFTDVRFDNEAEFIKRRGGKIIQIHRKDPGTSSHESEKGINAKYIDHTVGNNGKVEDFKANIIKAVKSFYE